MKWIAHVDVDAFFASVEQARTPSLRGRPIIVGGDGDQRTVVASCSYEARAYGVRNAMRTTEARRLCPDAIFLPGDHRVYQAASHSLRTYWEDLSPRIQAVSLDGAYLDLSAGGVKDGADGLTKLESLCQRVWNDLHLPLSAGLGTSRLIARMATGLAKPRGCFWVRQGYERAFVHPFRVDKLPGVGPKTAEMLHAFHVETVADLACVPREILVATFGRRGEQIHAFADGRDDSPVEPGGPPRSVSRETSLSPWVTTRGVLFGLASYLLERGMREVKAHGLRVRTLSLKLRWAGESEVEQSTTLPEATGHEANLVPLLDRLLTRLFTRRLGVSHIGITLRNLVPRGDHQGELFPNEEEERCERLGEALTTIRERHGFGAVIRGPAIELLNLLPKDRDGFRLRIPSLTR